MTDRRGNARETRTASVTRDPVTMEFVANWSDESDSHLEGPTFAEVEDAVAWAREQADVVIVSLGFARPQSFSAGATYVVGEDVERPLQSWPPEPDQLARLLDDQDIPDVGWPLP